MKSSCRYVFRKSHKTKSHENEEVEEVLKNLDKTEFEGNVWDLMPASYLTLLVLLYALGKV